MLTVENMTSAKGNTIPNHFIIKDTLNRVITFQSYNSVIVEVDELNDIIRVYPYYDYSRTTAKYLYLFMEWLGLEELTNKKAFEKALKLGSFENYELIKCNY